MIPSIDDLSRRGFFIEENRRGHLQSRHMTLSFQIAMLGRPSPQDNQICCQDRLLEESSLPLLGDVIDLECCKEEGMPGMLVACTSTALVADLREDNQKEDPEEVIQKMQSYGPGRTLLPSYLPHGPEDPADPSTFVKSKHGWSIGVWAYPENAQERTKVEELVSSRMEAFSFSLEDLPGYHGPAGHFLIAPEGLSMPPPRKNMSRKARRWSPRESDAAKSKLEPLEKVQIIVPCNDNTYATNLVIAPKKDAEGNWSDTRIAVDWRLINSDTPTDPYPIPLPEQLFQDVGNSKYFSKLDMRQGFLQCHIPPELQHMTAFWFGNRLFMYTRCGYGMKNSPAHFQRVMDRTLSDATTRIRVPQSQTEGPWTASGSPPEDPDDMAWEWKVVRLSQVARAYIDDVLISSRTFEEHLEHIKAVLDALLAVGLKVHPEKSLFACPVLEYLGVDIGSMGITPSQAKVQAIRALPVPVSVESLRRLLGFTGFYRNFIVRYSEMTKPLTELLCKGVPWDWDTNPCRGLAWEALKTALCKPGNALRRADLNRPFVLHTDWSKAGLSAVLGQVDDEGHEYLVAAVSRSNSKYERGYGSYRGEMLAAVFGVRSMRQYLHGSKFPFKLYTDHKGLKWLMTTPNLEGQYARWAVLLSDYTFTIEYKPGTQHAVADVPSRDPHPSTVDRTGSREPEPDDHTARFISATSVLLSKDALMDQWAHDAVVDRSNASALCLLAALLSSAFLDTNAALPPLPLTDSNPQASLSHLLDKESLQVVAATTHNTVLNSSLLQGEGHSSLPILWCSQLIASSSRSYIDEHDMAYTFPLCGLAAFLCLDQDVMFLNSQAVTHVSSQLATLASWAPYQPSSQWLATDDELPQIMSIDSTPVSQQCISTLVSEDVVVLELFGGICSGLEMLLRSGVKVSRYLYSDISSVAQRAALARLEYLTNLYPHLLSFDSWIQAFTSIPANVYDISQHHLVQAGATSFSQWIVIAGFECQDLSPAGQGRGLQGRRSATFYPLLSLLGELQFLQQARPPLYLIENTAGTAVSHPTPQVRAAYDELCSRLGTPILLDAARVGSYAHRLRNYWTNLVRPDALQLVLDSIQRDPSLSLSTILDSGRSPQICQSINPLPWYQANAVGQVRKVLPTLVATQQSYAFRLHNGGTGAGMVITAAGLQDLSLRERELAMGYQPFLSTLPFLSFAECHTLLGQAFDANAVHALFSTGLALRLLSPATQELGGESAGLVSMSSVVHCSVADLSYTTLMNDNIMESQLLFAMTTAAAMEETTGAASLHDPWNDVNLLHYLKVGSMTNGVESKEKDRVVKRAHSYVWKDHKLCRRFQDGSVKEVPESVRRTRLIRQVHEAGGHFGHRRTTQQLLLSYWWPRVYQDVRAVCRDCEACDRSHVHFNTMQPVLHPLPIKGLFYRWGMDLAGPFPASSRGNTYILVCVEHFSKWIEVFPLQDKCAAEVAYYASQLFARFLAPAEVVTDGGGEFEGEFQDLLQRLLIDHRVTSPNHPQANGLAERVVGTVKSSIKRYNHAAGPAAQVDWDLFVPYITMGYNITPQASTKFSPYQLIFAVPPIIPSGSREKFDLAVSFDDQEAAATSILIRAAALRTAAPMAGQNLHIAQHRDELRYARLRSKDYHPQVATFVPGQYVYLSRLRTGHKASGFNFAPLDVILRVVESRVNGTLLLVGSCGSTTVENAVNCSPCHLLIESSSTPSSALFRYRKDLPCELCHFPDREESMLLCDSCQKGYHVACLGLTVIPGGTWLCPGCSAEHQHSDSAKAKEGHTTTSWAPTALSPAIQFDVDFWDLPMARRAHGKYLRKPFMSGTLQKLHEGLIKYMGIRSRPYAFKVTYDDGDSETMCLAEVLHYLKPLSAPTV